MTPQQLKQIRLKLGLTQAALAVRLGFSGKHGGDHVRRLESGKRNITKRAIMLFIKRLISGNMSDTKIISNSIVFIDDTFSKLKLPQQNQQIIIDNPFDELANANFLKMLVKSVLNDEENFKYDITKSNPTQKTAFNFGNLNFGHSSFPPKFSIEIKDDKNDKTKSIATYILDNVENLKDKIKAVGVNYAFFLPDEKKSVKDSLLKDNISSEFDGMSIALSNNIDDNTTLNLRVADAVIEGEKGFYCDANFNNNINEDSDNIEDIIKKDFLEIARKKINKIF
jgi:hypothetical protein